MVTHLGMWSSLGWSLARSGADPRDGHMIGYYMLHTVTSISRVGLNYYNGYFTIQCLLTAVLMNQ